MNIITCIDFLNKIMTETMMKRFDTQLCFILVCIILKNIQCYNIVNGFCFVRCFTECVLHYIFIDLRFFNDPHFIFVYFIRVHKHFMAYLWCDSN